MMAWQVVEFALDETVSEAAAEALKRAGAEGVAEEWRQGQTYVRGFWQDAEEARVAATTAETLALLVEVGLLETAPPFTITTMEDQDWLHGWKQYFTPLTISTRLAIVPSWERVPARPGQVVVTLDPGMAFGTGAHGTTFTCLQALSDYLQSGMAVCDVGAGSGILAIAAVKLGAGVVIGTDDDPLAIRTAIANAEQNDVASRIDFRLTSLLDGVDGPFDLLIANIYAHVIQQLIPALPRVLPEGGVFISSGYITSQEPGVRAALHDAGYDILQRYEREDWVTLVATRTDTDTRTNTD